MELKQIRWLGRTTTVEKAFVPKLVAAEEWIQARYQEQLDIAGPGVLGSFAEWHGVRSVGGYRRGGGMHGKGLAIDVDYKTNPYIATRTGRTLGGEQAGAHLGVRAAAIEACDRAAWHRLRGARAALHGRQKGETTEAVWTRFQDTSLDLQQYFRPFFRAEQKLIDRRPIPGRKVEDFQVLEESGELYVPASQVPLQVLQDYELVRIPMVVGSPSKTPGVTRNPARGLMDLKLHVVVALCDIAGCRWGMSDFGPLEAGDGMHFDTAKIIYSMLGT